MVFFCTKTLCNKRETYFNAPLKFTSFYELSFFSFLCSRSNFIHLNKHYSEVIFFLVICFYHVWEYFSVIFGLLILKIDLTFSNLVFPLSHLQHFVSHGRCSFLFSWCVIFCRIANFPYITASSILPKVSFFLPPPTSNKQYLYSKEIELCMWYTEEGKEPENCKI